VFSGDRTGGKYAAFKAVAAVEAALVAYYTASRGASKAAVAACEAASTAAARSAAYAYVAIEVDEIAEDDISDTLRTHTKLAYATQRQRFLELLADPVFPVVTQ
jgi:hypothetical protein